MKPEVTLKCKQCDNQRIFPERWAEELEWTCPKCLKRNSRQTVSPEDIADWIRKNHGGLSDAIVAAVKERL
jgi:hypothetical protein